MRKLLIFICCATLILGQKPAGRPRSFQAAPAPPPPPPLPPPDPFPDIPIPDPPPFPDDIIGDPLTDIPEPPWDIPIPDPPDFPPDPPMDWDIPPPDIDDFPDPFLDPPSIEGESNNGAKAIGHSPLIFNEAPRQLAFFPSITPSGSTAAAAACDPKIDDTRVFIADGGHNRVIALGACPHRFLTAIPVGTHPSGINSPPDASTLWVTNLGSASISIIDAETYAVTSSINLPPVDGVTPQPATIAFTPDGAKAYVSNHVGSGNGPVVFSIDVATKKVTGLLRVAPFPTAVKVTPDGAQVWVTCAPDGVVYVFDTLSETLVARIAVPVAGGLTFLPNGAIAYVGTVDSPGFVTAIDMITYKPIATIAVGNYPGSVEADPSGRHVFVAHLGSSFISMINTGTNTVTRTLATKMPTRVLTFLR